MKRLFVFSISDALFSSMHDALTISDESVEFVEAFVEPNVAKTSGPLREA